MTSLGLPEARSFLLNDVTASEREAFEERALFEDGFFDHLVTEEKDLLDEAARDELATAEARRFERRRESVASWSRGEAFSRALSRRADGEPAAPAGTVPLAARRQPVADWRRWASIAALLAVCLGTAWSVGWLSAQRGLISALESSNVALEREAQSLGRQLEAERGERTAIERQASVHRAENQRLAAEATRLEEQVASLETAAAVPSADTPRSGSLRTIAFHLSLATLRGEEGASVLRVPAAAERVRLQLDLLGDTDYASFVATVTDGQGREVVHRDDLALTEFDWGAVVELELRPTDLPAGRYEVALVGVGSDGTTREVGFYSVELAAS